MIKGRDGETYVGDLAAFLGLTEWPSPITCGCCQDQALVRKRRDGQTYYCLLEDEHVSGLLRMGLYHVRVPGLFGKHLRL